MISGNAAVLLIHSFLVLPKTTTQGQSQSRSWTQHDNSEVGGGQNSQIRESKFEIHSAGGSPVFALNAQNIYGIQKHISWMLGLYHFSFRSTWLWKS